MYATFTVAEAGMQLKQVLLCKKIIAGQLNSLTKVALKTNYKNMRSVVLAAINLPQNRKSL